MFFQILGPIAEHALMSEPTMDALIAARSWGARHEEVRERSSGQRLRQSTGKVLGRQVGSKSVCSIVHAWRCGITQKE
jgi:hypothetical protein